MTLQQRLIPTQRSQCRFLYTETLVEVWCCASVVELEAMGVAVDAVVVTDATKHHPSLKRATFSFPPLLWTITLARGHNFWSIIFINKMAWSHHEEQLVGNHGAGGNNFVNVRSWGRSTMASRRIASLGSLLHWHISHCNKLPWLSASCLLVDNLDTGRSWQSNPKPTFPAWKATPLVVFCIVCEATLLALPWRSRKGGWS